MAEKSAAEKMMIKPGRSVRFINPPSDLDSLLGDIPEGVDLTGSSNGTKKIAPVDVIVLFANNRIELVALLPGVRKSLAEDGLIWVAYHKGTSPVKTDINRDNINTYAHTLSLQPIAMISINGDWSALRLKTIGGRI